MLATAGVTSHGKYWLYGQDFQNKGSFSASNDAIIHTLDVWLLKEGSHKPIYMKVEVRIPSNSRKRQTTARQMSLGRWKGYIKENGHAVLTVGFRVWTGRYWWWCWWWCSVILLTPFSSLRGLLRLREEETGLVRARTQFLKYSTVIS